MIAWSWGRAPAARGGIYELFSNAHAVARVGEDAGKSRIFEQMCGIERAHVGALGPGTCPAPRPTAVQKSSVNKARCVCTKARRELGARCDFPAALAFFSY